MLITKITVVFLLILFAVERLNKMINNEKIVLEIIYIFEVAVTIAGVFAIIKL